MVDRAAAARFRRSRPAMAAVRGLLALALLAVFAPLLAADRPLVYLHGGGLEFPVFRHLFDRNVAESPVDLFVNPLVLELPLFLLALAGLRWRGRRPGFRWPLLAGLLHLALFAALLAAPSAYPYRDFRAEAVARRARGEAVFLLETPLGFSPAECDTSGPRPSPPDRRHPFGTDREGRDTLARLLFALRGSLLVGFLSVGLFTTLGVVAGALAGRYGGLWDALVTRLTETALALPPVLLLLAVSATLPRPGLLPVLLVAGGTLWTDPARLARAEFRRLRHADFVWAARAIGVPERRILLRHLLPNAIPPVLVAAAFGVGQAILIEAAVAFTGFADPLRPTLGGLLAAGRTEGKLFLLVPPGLVLFLLVALSNGIAEGVRDALDPRHYESADRVFS